MPTRSDQLPGRMVVGGGFLRNAALYLNRQAGNPARYLLEQLVLGLGCWVPTLVGIGIRAALYRLILNMDGVAAIENGVRLRYCSNIILRRGSYLDQGVYLHACPNGIDIGARTLVMHGSVLHVYNFRGLSHSGIRIGEDCLVGELNVMRGQGGIRIGNRVYTSPHVQILAVDHVYANPSIPFVDQGITAEGVTIEDDVWVGAGAIICDGVTVGKGSVIAAGAVVTQSIPPFCLAGGVPARVVKTIQAGTSCSAAKPVYL